MLCSMVVTVMISKRYYDWIKRKDKPSADAELTELIRVGYNQSRKTYGYRRQSASIRKILGLSYILKDGLRHLFKCQMEQSKNGQKELRKAGLLVRYLRTCFSIMRLTSGWKRITQTNRLLVMRMMLWLTAVAEEEAEGLLKSLETRFAECGLELHPIKTRIVYCKDDDRRGNFLETTFDFLGYTFRTRRSKNKYGKVFINFTPAVSNKAKKAMQQTIHDWRMHLKPDKTL